MNYKNPLFIFSLIIVVFLIYAGVMLFNMWPINFRTIGQAGVFGDSFGVLTALFSALAFGGLIITVWQQQEELQQNREEIRTQHFENILFRMLEVHTEILRDLDIYHMKNKSLLYSGRDCFSAWYRYLKAKYKKHEKYGVSGNELIIQSYAEFWEKWNKDLGHYFRFLYNIFKHIDCESKKHPDATKYKEYANIIRAQLSDYELLIIFYNCLYVHGYKKFKPLAEKYELFDNLPIDLLLDENHVGLYGANAFGK